MAKVSDFTYTNKTASTEELALYKLGLTTNYTQDKTNNTCVCKNRVSDLDAEERITFSSRPIARTDTGLQILYPAANTKSIQYDVKVEEVLKTTDSADPSFRVDNPIVMSLQIRHERTGFITETILNEVWKRLNSAITKEDGTTRFMDLARESEAPIAD
jgi:hypothetical protein